MEHPDLPAEFHQDTARYMARAPAWVEYFETIANSLDNIVPREESPAFIRYKTFVFDNIIGLFSCHFHRIRLSDAPDYIARAMMEAHFDFFQTVLGALILASSNAEWQWVMESEKIFRRQLRTMDDMFDIYDLYLDRLKAMIYAYLMGLNRSQTARIQASNGGNMEEST